MPKNITLRLDETQAATLDMVARADGQTTTDAVRAAIEKHIAERRTDPDFQDRLVRIRDESRAVLDALAK